MNEHNRLQNEAKLERRRNAMAYLDSLNITTPIALGSGPELIQMIKEGGHGYLAAHHAVSSFVRTPDYLRSIIEQNARHDLCGKACSPVSQEHKDLALITLRRMAGE